MRIKFFGRYLSIQRYIKDVYVDKAKKRCFPKIRGTWLPSTDWQVDNSGIAINWLSVRVKLVWKRSP